MKKRMLSMLLAIVMVVGLLPTTVLAADGPPDIATVSYSDDYNDYDSFTSIEAAIEAAINHSGSTLEPLYNITKADPILIDSGSFTIDLGDMTWKSSSSVLQIGGTANITITDNGYYGDGKLLSTDEAAHEIVLCGSAGLKINKGTVGSICYQGGTIDLSDYADPTGITIYVDSEAVEPSISAIDLPEGYVMLDGSGNVANSLVSGNTYTVGINPESATEYPLWVGGTQVTSVNASDVFGDGTVSFTPAEGETPDTLTLNNYTYEGAGYQVSDEEVAAIYYCGSDALNLVLEGNSTVTLQSETAPTYSYGIYSSIAGITVSGTGTGSLTAAGGTADDQSFGVWVKGNITVNSGKLTGIGEVTDDYSYGVHADEITVSGGSLTGIGSRVGVHSSGVTINGGEVVASGAKWAFTNTPTIAETFNAAVWYGESEDDAMSNGAKDKSVIANADDAKYVKIAPVTAYDLWVGGTQVTSVNAYDVFKDGTVSYNTGTNTLTLTDYTYEGAGYEYSNWTDEDGTLHVLTAAIYSRLRGLTIELVGENKLTNTTAEGDGIYAGDTITISGNGSVEIVTNEGDGIRLNGDGDRNLTISGINVSISAGGYGIVNSTGTIELANGVFNITAGEVGIALGGDLTVTNSTVDITAGNSAVNVSDFSLGDGAWYQWTTDKDGAMTSSEKTPFVYSDNEETTYLKIAPFDLYVGGVAMVDGDYLASGATETTTTAPDGGYAHYENGELTLNNYTYNGEKYAIQYLGVQGSILNIDLVGQSSVTLTNDNSFGLTALRNITVSGSGSLSIAGGGYGVSVMGDLIISSGSLSATGTDYGVHVYGDFIVNAGNLGATGTNYGGVSVMGDLIVNAGNLSATGGNYGVNVMGDLIINSGSMTATGGSGYGVMLSFLGNFSLGDGAWYQWTTTEGGEMTSSEDTPYDYATNKNATYLKIEPLKTSDDDTPTLPQDPDFPIIPSDPTYPPVVDGGNYGDVSVSPKNPEKGDTVVITPDPDAGYEVDEVIVTDKNGNPVTVVDNGDGTYSFKQPSGKVNIEVTFKEIIKVCPGDKTCPMYGYTDLDRTAWYHDGVHFAIENGLMNGIGDNQFNPGGTTTRAMIVTILWRLEGSPVVNYAMDFEDVAADQWYTEAIRWAASEKIVEGYGDSRFGTNDAITREQFVTIMFRYAKYKGYDVSVGENTDILSYDDAFDVAEWAIPAMQWACGSSMIQGIADGSKMNLEPQGNATRAQAATILYRFVENMT